MNSAAAQARAIAARALRRVQDGRSLDEAMAEVGEQLSAGLAAERPLIQELCFGTTRWLLPLRDGLRSLLHKPIRRQDAELESLLLIGLYQLAHMRIPDHAAINETVAATAVLEMDWARRFVNAVLRRAQRKPASAAVSTHPDWLLSRIRADYPDCWPPIVAANDARPPMSLRIHLGRTTRSDYVARLQAAGVPVQATRLLESGITLDAPVPVGELPGFAQGDVSVQDLAAQLAAELLDAGPGMRVLDACAAPGGKTTHILERTPDAQMLAIDIDADRLQRVRDNMTRLGVQGVVRVADANRPAEWWNGEPFDRILLDAPCSGSGVIRRHPDIRIHRRPEDLTRLARRQRQLLETLWPLLASGGKLLYVTCSIFKEENRDTVAGFIAGRHDVTVDRPDHPLLATHGRFDDLGVQILPGEAGMDGFYYATLVRTAGSPAS